MYCKNCGRPVPEGSLFCPFCGTRVEAAGSKGEKKSNRQKIIMWAAVATLIVSLSVVIGTSVGDKASNAKTKPKEVTEPAVKKTPQPTAKPTPKPTVEPTQEPKVDVVKQHLDDAEAYCNKGDYHKAFGELLTCPEEDMDDDDKQRFIDIYNNIDRETSRSEPVSGKEFERTFTYQGGGELRVEAESGPVVVLVRDVDNSRQYSRFYVRENEIGVINLPGGSYKVSYTVGYFWFGNSVGFGDYCYDGEFDELLKFNVTEAGGWITNTAWNVTI